MRGGDASEGDRQDEPEDGGNHAQRPTVTLLPLAPLVLLVTQPLGRTFARWPRGRILARCRSRPSPYELTRVGSGTFYQKQRWALYWQNSRALHTLTQVRLGMHVWPPLPSGNARGFLKGCHPLSSPRPETRASCRGSQGNLLRAFSCPSGAPPVKNHSKQSFRKVRNQTKQSFGKVRLQNPNGRHRKRRTPLARAPSKKDSPCAAATQPRVTGMTNQRTAAITPIVRRSRSSLSRRSSSLSRSRPAAPSPGSPEGGSLPDAVPVASFGIEAGMPLSRLSSLAPQ